MFVYHPLTAAPLGSFVVSATAKSIVLAVHSHRASNLISFCVFSAVGLALECLV